MNKVFLDTNILLDLVLKRKGKESDSYQKALEIVNFCIVAKIPIYFSILSLKDISYIVPRLAKTGTPREKQLMIKEMISGLIQIGNPLSTSVSAMKEALHSTFNDFEDALQNYTATEAGANILITNNKKDFTKSKLRIYTPTEFLGLPIS